MNWNALAAWTYESSPPDITKAKAHGIGVIYIDPRSSDARAQIDAIRAGGIVPGIYAAASWGPTDPASFAKWSSDALQQWLPRPWPAEAPPFMADLEIKDVAWVQTFLRAYREYQPQRPSSYTNEPFQGGYVPVKDLASANFHVYVQTYYGDMSPADPAAALLEIARQGMPPTSLHPFYDGAALPRDARDGCVFTLERLP